MLLAEYFAQGSHQQGEVLCVVGRRGDARSALGGIFPVDVNAVQSELVHHAPAVERKGLPVLLGGCHLAKASATPASYGQHHLQGRILLLETDNHTQAVGIVYSHAIECVVDMPESVVDVGHHCGVGYFVCPGRYVGHYNHVLSVFLLSETGCRQTKCGQYQNNFGECSHF